MLKFRFKKLNKNKKKGFTLLELIVNMSIVGIIMVIVTTLTTSSLKSFNRQQDKLDAIAVSNLVMSTIKSNVEKVGRLKLDPFFEESYPAVYKTDSDGNIIKDSLGRPIVDYYDKSGKPLDQTGNNKPDFSSCYKTGSIYVDYPMCYDEMMDFFGIFVKSKNWDSTTNKQRHEQTGYARAGKVYFIERNNPEKPIDFIPETIVDSSDGSVAKVVKGITHNVVMGELIDPKLYRGYDVDVRFKYLPKRTLKEANETKANITSDILPQTSTDYLYDCIGIEVDVYNSNGEIIYSTSDTITFIQPKFKMEDPRTMNLDGYKDIIMFR